MWLSHLRVRQAPGASLYRASGVINGDMGLTFGKSVNVGPFRFNLSSSGIGLSTGIKGLRIGTGPRGTYISASAGGFRYRSYLNSRQGSTVAADLIPQQPIPTEDIDTSLNLDPHTVRMTQLERTNVAFLTDASSTELLDGLNDQAKRVSLVKVVNLLLLIAVGIGIWSYAQSPSGNFPVAAAASIFACYLLLLLGAYYADLSRLQTVLMFDVTARFQAAYQNLLATFEVAGNCTEIKCIRAEGRVTADERKYQIGRAHV